MLWDRKTGLEIVHLPVVLRPTAYWIEGVAFSPDGHVLAYSKAVGEIGLWDCRIRQSLHSIDVPDHDSSALSLAFSPNGQLLAAGGHDGLTVWDWPDRTVRIRFILTNQWTAGVSFSPDSERLASTSDDQRVRLWNLRTGTLDRTLSGHEFEVWSSGFLPDGRSLVTGAKDRTIRIWPLGYETWGPDQRIVEAGLVAALAPDASVALIQQADGRFELFHCDSMEGQPLSLPPVEDVTGVAVAPAGWVIAIGTASGAIRRFQTAPAAELPVIHTTFGEVKRMVFSGDGKRMAAALGNRRVGVRTGTDPEPTLLTLEMESSVWSICPSDDSRQSAVGSVLGQLIVWDLAARKSRSVDTFRFRVSLGFRISGFGFFQTACNARLGLR